uniref:CoA-binding protein n=2 Tax=Arsenophonus nasoniae TaxID=638 RepID=D2TZI6_9GAMM|nr:CoA-binding protein [Arsenophonus nasoniae]
MIIFKLWSCHKMLEKKLTNILTNVKYIALVGASDKVERPSYKVMKYLINQGYNVTPVSPKLAGKELLGQKVYAQLADIPYPIDMVQVFRNSAAALEVSQQAIAINAKVLWLQLGVINEEAKEMAEQAGLAVVMNACPKIEIPRLGLEK